MQDGQAGGDIPPPRTCCDTKSETLTGTLGIVIDTKKRLHERN